MPKNLKWLPSLHDPGPPRLWRIGYALTACFAVAVGGLAALWGVALVLLHHPALPNSKTISVHDTVGVAQLVFASVAGAGALVALVVAYRRQRVAEGAVAHDRTRVFNERFTAIATQLGDGQAAVRLAGVHAMAGLADEWTKNRQTCVDVLCAYLRLPYDPDPGQDADPLDRATYRANREVRHTVIRVIGRHLRLSATVSWEDVDLDFTGVVFDGGEFAGARFSRAVVRFDEARFVSGEVSFEGAEFSGGAVSFASAVFSGGEVNFSHAKFSAGQIDFNHAMFAAGEVSFDGAKFCGALVNFFGAWFNGAKFGFGAKFSNGEIRFWRTHLLAGKINFDGAVFSGAKVGFNGSRLSGTQVEFNLTDFSGGEVGFPGVLFCGSHVVFNSSRVSGAQVSFMNAMFTGGKVGFYRSLFLSGQVSFRRAKFSSGQVEYDGAEFSGSDFDFTDAEFSGGKVDFSNSRDWSHPPVFPWKHPPSGVTLPVVADAEQA